MSSLPQPTSKTVRIEDPDLRLHYLEAGEGDAVLLLHGWPTSAHLWRDVMRPIARSNRVIALDLPGFGGSDKPRTGSYSFRYHERALEGFLRAIDVERVSLVVHDLGGPIGLYWAVRHPEKLIKLALLNTLVYPETSWMVKLFVISTLLPGVKQLLSSPAGIAFGMRFGTTRELSEDTIRAYQAPFAERDARKVLLRTGHRLHPKGMREIAEKLPALTIPVRLLYGEEDRILPDVAETMRRVQRDLPQAELSSLPGCGHFLQEDRPDEVGRLLAEFLQP